MKTKHFQPALISGHSTEKGKTGGTNRLRNEATVKELEKLALQRAVTRESLKILARPWKMRTTEVTVTMTTSKMDRGKEQAKKTETRMIWHTHVLFLITHGKRRVEWRWKKHFNGKQRWAGFLFAFLLWLVLNSFPFHTFHPKLAVSYSA